ncbi:hypothetical protein FSP39_023665 [Pinctada imbricata]|uniref:EF-hand domain-containing protein n=1 Tax=Pinctada imbricata TaxID=66713 RepID=A0AA88XGF1_PINIB|nr:hypothetical protein FSP39_023665 [Pinctada imbricata]
MSLSKPHTKNVRLSQMDWLLTRCDEAEEEGYVSDGAEADQEDEGYDEEVDPEVDLNRMTISRASSRKSRPESSGSRLEKYHVSDSESDDETRPKPPREVTSDYDFTSVDITDEKAFDTDLEVEEATSTYDHSGRTTYIEGCKKVGVVPASYFLRHMHDPKLSMKHHGLGSHGMKAIAMSLVSNTKILELDLSDNWLGHDGGLAVCEMLKENCFITNLNLSDNRLGARCAETLSKILQQNTTLTHVRLSGNDFDDKAAVHIADALLNTTKLEYLNLSHNLFGEMAGLILGPAISENSSLKELDLSWNSLRRKGAVAVAQGIKQNIFLRKVNLSWNGFGLDGAIALGDALKVNCVLEELNVSNNRITTEGSVLLGKGLSANETLQVLKLGRNPMQTAGCYAICAAILRNPNCTLQEIDFSDILVNKDFEDIFKQVQEQLPDIKMRHGGMEPPMKPRARIHPMIKLTNYIEKNNLRLVEFFNKFDKDGSMSVTYEEFEQGIEETGLKLSHEEVQILLKELDSDGDGEINYSELVSGHTGFQEQQQENINIILTATQGRPLTT